MDGCYPPIFPASYASHFLIRFTSVLLMRIRCRFLFVISVIVALIGGRESGAAEPVNFSRDVLPILSDNCFQCHGPDPKSREAELRFDTQEGALRKEKPVIVPGKSGESELVKRLLSTDPDERMPPPKSNKTLTPKQIELVKKWIDAGAPWGKHWAFEKPRRPEIPNLKFETSDLKSNIRNPIDSFIVARLEKEKLKLAPEAAKETLLRRVTLDLTGLPPTLEEIDAFVADKSPEAYENVVDRLLKSPRYGERMVWEWLDAARYADTNGYQGDPTRSMYFWRDWVIAALNNNMPFDQFTVEQIAGDLLPNPSQEQLIATGFHRNHMINGEGGRIAEESRVDYVQDRVETTGTVWLGLTFNCCRCHDHKFDPLKQREYYQLSAYFNSIEETGGNDAGGLANPIISFASAEQKQRIEELKAIEKKAATERDLLDKKLGEQQVAWEQSILAGGDKSGDPVWVSLAPDEMRADEGTELTKLEDGSIIAQGKNPAKDRYTVSVKTKLGPITGIRLEALPSGLFVNSGPGRADNGNFVLSEFQVEAHGKPVSLSASRADFEQGGFPLSSTIDGKLDTGWAVMPRFGKPLQAIYEVRSPVGGQDPNAELPLTFTLSFQFGREHTLGCFKLYVTTSPMNAKPVADEIRTLVQKPADQRNDAEKKKLSDYFRDTQSGFATAKKRAEDLGKERAAYERSTPRTMVMRERPQPRETFILIRGAYDKYGEKVSHGVPETLPPLPADAPTSRLALAQWLVSPEQPLTARVTVNRIWQMFFGNGLVKTADDFGIQGDRPSHPELLDWLACEFREPTVSQPSVVNSDSQNRWNVKHLHRLIVTSATYRQSSKISSGMLERDPENRLLARGARYRLPSWMIRDQALAASGLLVEKVGGPAVKGYQPPGIWEEATFGKIGYTQDHGEALYRRSLYTFWRRIVGPTVFFDVANRQTCQVKTGRTNTPLHALVTLNDVTYAEAARALAERLLTDSASPTPEARIDKIVRVVLGRRPATAETKVLLGAMERLKKQFASDPEGAKKLVQAGESKRNEKIDPVEQAVWASVATIVLNLDETLTKE